MSKINQQQIIEQIETLLTQLKQSLNIANKNLPRNKKGRSLIPRQQGFAGLTADIYKLVEEGFFDDSKTISDLRKKLKARGINKPTTSLMPSLKLLIKKEVLDRDKPDKGLYKYFKR